MAIDQKAVQVKDSTFGLQGKGSFLCIASLALAMPLLEI
jgi:hypothetical protein